MALKQFTMSIEGFITFTADENTTEEDVLVQLDAFDKSEIEDSTVEEIHETKITIKEIQTKVDI